MIKKYINDKKIYKWYYWFNLNILFVFFYNVEKIFRLYKKCLLVSFSWKDNKDFVSEYVRHLLTPNERV